VVLAYPVVRGRCHGFSSSSCCFVCWIRRRLRSPRIHGASTQGGSAGKILPRKSRLASVKRSLKSDWSAISASAEHARPSWTVLHPGFVATRFGDQSGGRMSRVVSLAKFFAISPARGAQIIVYLASSPDVAKTTGRYFYQSVPAKPSPEAQDDQTALLLWQRSATMAGMKEWP
jgi:hypothetical protein